MASAARVLSEDVLEALHKFGASQDLIDVWSAEEATLLQQCSSDTTEKESPVPVPVRQVALQLLQNLITQAGLQFKGWCEACLLFDLFYLRAPEGSWKDSIPAVCVAVVGLVKRNDSAVLPCDDMQSLLTASRFMESLTELGVEATKIEELTAVTIQKQERAILKALEWRISPSTTFSWISTLNARINILTGGSLSTWLEWTWCHALSGCQSITLLHAASSTSRPRELACGLFCLSVARSGLLSVSALRPERVTEAECQDRLHHLTQSREEAAMPGAIPAEHAVALLEILEAATGFELSAIRDHVWLVMSMLEVLDTP